MRRSGSTNIRASPRASDTIRRTIVPPEAISRDPRSYMMMHKAIKIEKDISDIKMLYSGQKFQTARTCTTPSGYTITASGLGSSARTANNTNHTRKKSYEMDKFDYKKRPTQLTLPMNSIDTKIKVFDEFSVPTISTARLDRETSSISQSMAIRKASPSFTSSMANSPTRYGVYPDCENGRGYYGSSSRPAIDQQKALIQTKKRLLSSLKDRVQDLVGSIEEERKIFDAKYEDVCSSISKTEVEFLAKKQQVEAKRKELQQWFDKVIADNFHKPITSTQTVDLRTVAEQPRSQSTGSQAESKRTTSDSGTRQDNRE